MSVNPATSLAGSQRRITAQDHFYISVALPCDRVFPIASLGAVFLIESHVQQAGGAQKPGM